MMVSLMLSIDAVGGRRAAGEWKEAAEKGCD